MKAEIQSDVVEGRWLVVLVVMAALTSLIALVVGLIIGVPTLEIYSGYIGAVLLLSVPTLLLAAIVLTIRAMLMRVASPFAACRPFLAGRFGTFDRAAGTLGPIMIVPFILGAFGTLKQIMPLIAPFSWDNELAALDRMLFFGSQPWELTHRMFGTVGATAFIDVVYTLWVALLSVGVLGFAVFAPRDLRARFFLSFAGGWVLIGVIGAFFFASAGPCYAQLIGADSAPEYAGLLKRLQDINDVHALGAVGWQDKLWQAHASRQYGFAMGISAMPSMHNAVAFLYALCAARAAVWVRAGAFAFAGVILLGSVHLGWHYAVDGLFAWAAMALIWWGAGAYLRWIGYNALAKQAVNNVATAGDDLPAFVAA